MEFDQTLGLGGREFPCEFFFWFVLLSLLLCLLPTYAYFTDLFVARQTLHITTLTSRFYKEQLHGMRSHGWPYEYIYIIALTSSSLHTLPYVFFNLNYAKRAIGLGSIYR